jgi:hypothetical protein
VRLEGLAIAATVLIGRALWAGIQDAPRQTTHADSSRRFSTVEQADTPLSEPVRLAQAPAASSAVRGRVIDQDGDPVVDAELRLRSVRADGTGYERISAPENDGRFLRDDLEVGLTQRLAISARACNSVISDEWVAKAGEVQDLGTISLYRYRGVVAGRVVDTAEQPVVGVTVFNAGDGPQRVETTTDEQGRFRLDGLLGEAYAFVDSPEHRFEGVWAAAGAGDVTVVLRPKEPVTLGDPPPPRQPVLPPDEARELARQLLVEALKQTVGSQIIEREQLLKELAPIDVEEARVAAIEGGGSEATVDIAAGTAMLTEDFDAGLEMILRADDPRSAFWALHGAASTHKRDDPELALKCLEAADPLWPEIPGPSQYRLVAAAGLGGLLQEIDPGRGEQYLREVHARFMPMGMAPDEIMGRATFAAYYSVVDLEESLGLLAPMAEDQWAQIAYERIAVRWAEIDADRAVEVAKLLRDEPRRAAVLGRIAEQIAGRDPNKALSIIKQAGGAQYRLRPLVDVITSLPATHLDLALSEARSLPPPFTAFKGRAIGRLAYVAPAERAPAIIEEALDELMRTAVESGSTQWASDIGRLAYVARSVGYPEWREIALRATSCRNGAREPHPDDGIRRAPPAEYDLAYVLSFSDPEMARHVLTSALAIDGGIRGAPRGAFEAIASAAMQMDPRWAADLIGQMSNDDLAESHGYRTDAVWAAVRCLVRSPEAWKSAMLRGGGLGDWGRPRSAM